MGWRTVAALLLAALTLGGSASAQLATVQEDVAQVDLEFCGPTTVAAGETWTFVGRVTAQGHPVDEAWVQISVDDQNHQQVQTDGEGWFQASLSFGPGQHTVEANLAVRAPYLTPEGVGVVLPVSGEPLTVTANPAGEQPAMQVRPVCEIVTQPQGNSDARLYTVLSGSIDPGVGLDANASAVADVFVHKACPSWGSCNVDAVDAQHRGAATGLDVGNATFGLAVGPFLYDDQRAYAHDTEQCDLYPEIRHDVAVRPSPDDAPLYADGLREDVEVCG